MAAAAPGSITYCCNFTIDGTRYPYRVSSGQGGDGSGNRVHLSIDPGDRPLAADLEGVLTFQSRVPRFEGMATLALRREEGQRASTTPWKITAKVKANYSAAQLDQIELSYGTEDRALKLVGTGDARFGASPLLHAALSARQLDADKFMARDDDKYAAAPARVLPALRAALAALPRLPMASQIHFGAEQVMLGGRPLQNLSGGLHGDAALWAIGSCGREYVLLGGTVGIPSMVMVNVSLARVVGTAPNRTANGVSRSTSQSHPLPPPDIPTPGGPRCRGTRRASSRLIADPAPPRAAPASARRADASHPGVSVADHQCSRSYSKSSASNGALRPPTA